MALPTHNKYHRRILKHLHESGPEFKGTLIRKASGVTPAGNMRRQRERRAGNALANLSRHGLIRQLGRGKGKKRYTLTFEGWVFYATSVLEELDGQEDDHRRGDNTEQPADNGGSVGG